MTPIGRIPLRRPARPRNDLIAAAVVAVVSKANGPLTLGEIQSGIHAMSADELAAAWRVYVDSGMADVGVLAGADAPAVDTPDAPARRGARGGDAA